MQEFSKIIVSSLLKEVPTVSPATTNDEVFQLFEKNAVIQSIPVVDSTVPLGLITRHMMVGNYAKRYIRELRGRKSCSFLMDKNPVIVDQSVSIEEFSEMLIKADPRYLYSGFIITDQGKYIGMGFGDDLLRAHLIELRGAKKIAENSSRAKGDFLANMSHEIRTPMNAVIGLSQLALNTELTIQQRDYLGKILDSSKSLLGILNDILDFSKIEAGRMSIEHTPFNLAGVVDTLKNIFTFAANQKGLDFQIKIDDEVPLHLIGDSLRIKQVLTNLIGNAIKFTEHGIVALSVRLIRFEGAEAKIRFYVRDTGIGMSKEGKAKLFQPFSQTDASISRRFGGTGLGLVISHHLLKLMGSDLRVQSLPGKGSIFRFELLLSVAPREVEDVESYRRENRMAGELARDLQERAKLISGARILVAEDNRVNQQVVVDFLTLSGISVAIANNGEEVLELLKNTSFDAILMDVNMPVMDGMETARRIREQARFKDLPIIALTAGVTKEERELCFISGMNYFLPKPIDPDELAAMLSTWIKLDQQRSPETESLISEKMSLDLKNLPGFELERLLKTLRGDENRVAHLLCTFREEFAGSLHQIEARIDVGDWVSAEKLVHTLKGAAANMGAKRLLALSEKLDAELKQGDCSHATLNDFREAFKSSMTSLAVLHKKV